MDRPSILNDWSLELIRELLHQGYNEDVWFDFKERLPGKSDHQGKERIKSVIGSFANQKGGYLIFGISDKKDIPPEERVVGVPKEADYSVLLGNIIEGALIPRPDFQFKNPPVVLNDHMVLPICEVLESNKKPIAVDHGDNKFTFPIRTSKGTSFMIYDEVRREFVGYAFMKERLFLLEAELKRICDELRYLGGGSLGIPGATIQTDVLSSCLFHSYGLLEKGPFLISDLNSFKTTIALINADIQMTLALVPAYGPSSPNVQQSARGVKSTAESLRNSITNFLVKFEKFLKEIN